MRLNLRFTPVAGLLTLLAMGIGCAPEAEYTLDDIPTTPTALEWVQGLAGVWQVQSVESGECPADLGLPPLHGLSRWDVREQTLTISSLQDERPDLTLFVSEPLILLRSGTLDLNGCEVTEEVELRIDEQTFNTLEGSYSAHFFHDGSEPCAALVPLEAESTSCEIASQWQAYRISRSP